MTLAAKTRGLTTSQHWNYSALEDMGQENLTLNFELVHGFALAAERLRILATPTAIEILRRLLICEQQPDKSEMLQCKMYDDRSIRRTMRRMARLGLIRWQPWDRTGQVTLTRATKRILKAGGCNA